MSLPHNLGENKYYYNLSTSYEDFNRLSKLITRDEKVRIKMRGDTGSPRIFPVYLFSVNQSEAIKVFCTDVSLKEKEWILVIKCPFCNLKHEFNCGNGKLPKIGIKDSVCFPKQKYEFVLNEDVFDKINNLI